MHHSLLRFSLDRKIFLTIRLISYKTVLAFGSTTGMVIARSSCLLDIVKKTNDYHVEPTYGYFELIDEAGNPVTKIGQVGEIVGTSFHNLGMPLIRYRTGDFAEYVSNYCPACNRHVPIIRNIKGRWSGDKIYNLDGTFITTTALNLHSDLHTVINGLQYIQETKGHLDVLIIKSNEFKPQHEMALYDHLRTKLKADTVVNIQYVDRLRRMPNGKFVHLISSVAPESIRENVFEFSSRTQEGNDAAANPKT